MSGLKERAIPVLKKKAVEPLKKRPLSFFAAFTAAFLLSQLRALGDFSPFCTAFVSSVGYESCFSAVLGSFAGYLFSGSGLLLMRNLTAVLLTAVLRLVVLRGLRAHDGVFIRCLVSFCSTFCVGAVFACIADLSVVNILLQLVHALLSALGAMFFIKAKRAPIRNLGILGLPPRDSLSVTVCVTVLLMCAADFHISNFYPALIAVSLAVMTLALGRGLSFSSVPGILVGLSYCLSDFSEYAFFCFVVGAAACGLASALSQTGVAVSYAASILLVCFSGGFSEQRLYFVVHIICASVIFAALPPQRLTGLLDRLELDGILTETEHDTHFSSRLNLAADNVREVCAAVERAGEKLDRVINPELNLIFVRLQKEVCKDCPQKNDCWSLSFESTVRDIMQLTGIERKKNVKSGLEEKCLKLTRLTAALKELSPVLADSVAAKTRVSQMRELVCEQFCAAAMLLDETADRAVRYHRVDPSRSRVMKSAVYSAGYDVERCEVSVNESGCFSVEMSFPGILSAEELEQLRQCAKRVLHRGFCPAKAQKRGDGVRVLFSQSASYKTLVGYCRLACPGQSECGDSVSLTRDEQGTVIILSDGMGTGARAGIDSKMTATLMQKLVSCGFSFTAAAKSVNCALMARSTEESVASLDALSINHYTALAEFYKAGAAISFIRRGEQVDVIEEYSMPLGILKQAKPGKKARQLEAGDIILLVSDGATAGRTDWIEHELLSWNTANMKQLAQHVAYLARVKNKKDCPDDITVAAVKLVKNGQ